MDVGINIEANGKGALDALAKVKESTSDLAETLKSLSYYTKQFAKENRAVDVLGGGAEALERQRHAYDNLNKSIYLTSMTYHESDVRLKAYKKTMSDMYKVLREVLYQSEGSENGLTKQIRSGIELTQKQIRETEKEIAQEKRKLELAEALRQEKEWNKDAKREYTFLAKQGDELKAITDYYDKLIGKAKEYYVQGDTRRSGKYLEKANNLNEEKQRLELEQKYNIEKAKEAEFLTTTKNEYEYLKETVGEYQALITASKKYQEQAKKYAIEGNMDKADFYITKSNDLINRSQSYDVSSQESSKIIAVAQAQASVYEALGDKMKATKVKLDAYKESLKLLIKTEQNRAAVAEEAYNPTPEITKQTEELKKLDAEYIKLTHSTTSVTTRIKNLVKNFVSAQLIVYGIRKAFQLVTEAFTQWTKAASDAEEIANLFNTTFGSLTYSANKAASEMANAFGMAQSTAQNAIGTVGDLAYGYGMAEADALEFATTASQTLMDLMSFKNVSGDISDQLDEFTAGLNGAHRNLLKYGVTVKANEVNNRLAAKGFDKLTGSALEQAKMQERLNIVLEQSPRALGDMQRTMQSTENVTRRLKEQSKGLMEYWGSSINKWLTPLKSALADVAEQMNRVHEAEKEIANGASLSTKADIHDPKNGEANQKELEKDLVQLMKFADKLYSHAVIQMKQGTSFRDTYAGDSSNPESLVSKLSNLLATYNADAKDFEKIAKDLDFTINGVNLKEVLVPIFEEDRKARIEETAKRKVIENRNTELTSQYSHLTSLTETLSEIVGVIAPSGKFDGSLIGKFATSDSLESIGNKALDKDYNSLIQGSIDSLVNSTADTFLSAMQIAMGGSESEGLSTKQKSLTSLYESLYNEFVTNSQKGANGEAISNQEQKWLQDVVNAYLDTNKQIELLAHSIDEYSKKLSDYGEGKVTALNEAQRRRTLISSGMSEESADIQVSWEKAITELKAIFEEAKLKALPEEIEGLTREYDKALSATNAYYTDSKNEQGKTEAQTRTDALASADETIFEVMNPLTDAEKNLKSFKDALLEAGVSTEEATLKTVEYSNELTKKAEADERAARNEYNKQAAEDTLVPDFVSNITEGAQQGGWFGALMALLEELDGFNEILEATAAILEPINQILSPILPMVTMLVDLLVQLLVNIIEPLMPALKEIMVLLTYVTGYLVAFVNLIVDSVKWVAGKVSQFFVNMVNGIIDIVNHIPFVNIGKVDTSWADSMANTDVFGNFNKAQDRIADAVEAIRNTTYGIEENTSDNDKEANAYYEMYNKGLLSGSELDSMLAKLYKRNTAGIGLNSSLAVLGAQQKTVVYAGEYNFNITSNGDANELAQAILDLMAKNGMKDSAYSYR